ncbi:unnamed protein product [Malassezia sympodialis ATCC 42132]|uniref:uncharacterized protein n=1 Tax=Malassezia sympodialis (strain ATCC 42132) TaxID=1230383 RepID=UPI0002C21028|nr:uncharacterized protein MSY001_3102 [Malassezia sympodialis ATCC 42132]CCV00397.1 unnamed protein product [Malassezia sympodialis ATCC 42132]|eukprot:XP_018741595.1 uncharacterized protein MSY001_3102 [Malassezia sympodialis ATCC 42132]
MATGAATNASAPTKQKSKAYLSSVAIQSDAIKYRQKYKELKRKVYEIEMVSVTSTHPRKMTSYKPPPCASREIFSVCVWSERTILYERLEADMRDAPVKPSAIDPVREAKESTEKMEPKESDVTEEPASKAEDDAITSELEQTL